MKKIFLISILTLSYISTFAQATSQDVDPAFHFGMKINPALCWLRSGNSNVESDGMLLRCSYGFIADFKFANNYAFSTGIDISYKGGQLKKQTSSKPNDSTTVTTVYEEKSKIRYIEVPLTLRLKTNQIGLIKYYLQVGVAPGFNFNAYNEGSYSTQTQYPGFNNTTTTDVSKDDTNNDINFFNMSMIIGAGIEYNLSGTTNLISGITFNNGFLTISDKNADDALLQNSKLFANQLGLMVGILF